MTTTVASLGMLCMVARFATAQGSFAGQWQGYWLRSGDTLPVRLTIQSDSSTNVRAAFSSERLRVSGIPFAAAELNGCCSVTMTLRGDATTAVFTGELRADSLVGTFTEAGRDGRFAFARDPRPAKTFVERELTIQSGAAALAGTLLLPAGENPSATVVFIHGSGAESRWASRFLAEQIVEHGIAAFIYDKRGVGRSTGDWRTATLEDLAGDAVASIARLSREPNIERSRIGIHGHSQGGTLAPMVAALSPTVRFVIGSAAAGTPMDSTEIFSIRNSIAPRLQSRDDSLGAFAYTAELVGVAYHGRSRERLDSLAAAHRGRPWFFAPPAIADSYWTFSRVFARYEPLSWWARVRTPVLLVYGADDQRVPARESGARISAALSRAGNSDVTVRVFPGADHTFRLRPGPSGWPVTAPDYLTTLIDWLSKR